MSFSFSLPVVNMSRDAVSTPMDLGPISPSRRSQNEEQNQTIPESHLEHLPLVDVLAPVVVAVKHLPKEGVVELGIRLQALGALADVRQHQAGLPIRGQLVLLHAPVDHKLCLVGQAQAQTLPRQSRNPAPTLIPTQQCPLAREQFQHGCSFALWSHFPAHCG